MDSDGAVEISDDLFRFPRQAHGVDWFARFYFQCQVCIVMPYGSDFGQKRVVFYTDQFMKLLGDSYI